MYVFSLFIPERLDVRSLRDHFHASSTDEIYEDPWANLYRSESHPFPVPASGQIAIKVFNHFGDEVMKVYDVPSSL